MLRQRLPGLSARGSSPELDAKIRKNVEHNRPQRRLPPAGCSIAGSVEMLDPAASIAQPKPFLNVADQAGPRQEQIGGLELGGEIAVDLEADPGCGGGGR